MMTSLPHASVLVVDDEASLLLAISTAFRRAGWRAETASTLDSAALLLRDNCFDLVVCDVRLGDQSGFDLLPCVRQHPAMALLFLTAFATVPEAVRAIHGGAFDYLTKPVSSDHLLRVAQRIVTAERERSPVTRAVFGDEAVVNPLLFPHASRLQKLSFASGSLLLTGEVGTGKRSLARYLHSSGVRRNGPCIELDCRGRSPEELRAILFSATGESTAPHSLCSMAHGGTLLLTNAQCLPQELCSQLRAVAESGVLSLSGEDEVIPADIRFVACAEVKCGTSSGFEPRSTDWPHHLHLPALHERPEVLLSFVDHFWRLAVQDSAPLARPAAGHWTRQQWPRNLHDLRDSVEAWAHGRSQPRNVTPGIPPLESRDPRLHTMQEVERSHLERTLLQVNGNRTHAAERLGISVRTMRNKIRQYDLAPRRYA